ncbi:hypothetical protein MP228_011007 [Amoeboaphelidium protococcarum]|nr:hypothetical protein MP228_011007 [Amoeboaphelidium protococcarum]
MLRGLALIVYSFLYVPLLFYTCTKGFKTFTPFDFHPLGMCLGFAISAYGVRAFVTKSTAPMSYAAKKDNHAVRNFLAICAISFGGIAIFYSKYVQKKYHYETTHSLFGAVASMLMFLQFAAGFLVYNYPSVKNLAVSALGLSGKSQADIRRILWNNHAISAALGTILMFAAMLSAYKKEFIIGLHQRMTKEVVQAAALYAGLKLKVDDNTMLYVAYTLSSLICLGNLAQIGMRFMPKPTQVEDKTQ